MNTLHLTGMPAPEITIIPSAIQQKKDALELASTIKAEPTTSEEQQDCIAAASLAKGLAKSMEASRVDVKRPVLDIGAKIDAKAKEYSKELSAEVLRLESLAAAYQRKVDKQAADARRAEEERQRKERETADNDKERERRFMEDKEGANIEERRADLARIESALTVEEKEAARKIADDNADARCEEWRILQQSIAEADEQRLEDARERATAIAVVSAPQRAAGASVRRSYDYAVTDLKTLYAHRPDLVTLEPKRAMILAAISNGLQIPGLNVHETTKLHAK